MPNANKPKVTTNEPRLSRRSSTFEPPTNPSVQTVNYEAAFEATGHGCFNHLVVLACCLIFLYCSAEMAGMSYVITPIDCDINLSLAEKTLINGGIYIGIVFMSVFWGILVDQYGRRRIMLPTLIGTIISSFSSSLCSEFWSMFIFRAIAGCLVSASTGTALVYLGELHSKHHRDRAIFLAVTSDQVNFVFFPGLAWVIISGTWSFHLGPLLVRPWRVFMWSWGITGTIGAIILFFLPESPRFTLAKEGPYVALPVLANIYAINNTKSPEEYPVKTMMVPSLVRMRSEIMPGWKIIFRDMKELLKPPMLRCYLITHYCMFITYLLSNGFYMWMPAIINEVIKDTRCPCSICDVIRSKFTKASEWYLDPHADEECETTINSLMYPISIAMELVYLIPFIVIFFILGRVLKVTIFIGLMSVCAMGLLVCFLVKQVLVALVFLILGLCSGACVCIISAFAVEAFPTKLRALTMCTLYMMGQLGAVVGNAAIVFMQGVYCYVVFSCFILAIAFSALLLLRCWPRLEIVREEMERRSFTY